MRTSDIPFLNSTELAEYSSSHHSSSHHSSSSPSSSSERSGSNHGGLRGQRGKEGGTSQHDSAELTSPLKASACAGANAAERGGSSDGFREQPMFDPKVIDMDASTILR